MPTSCLHAADLLRTKNENKLDKSFISQWRRRGNVGLQLMIHLLIIFLVVWSKKCQKMVKNIKPCFQKAMLTSSNVLFGFQAKYIQFAVTEQLRNQEILTFNQLESENFTVFLKKKLLKPITKVMKLTINSQFINRCSSSWSPLLFKRGRRKLSNVLLWIGLTGKC